jgi:hypothetical protein
MGRCHYGVSREPPTVEDVLEGSPACVRSATAAAHSRIKGIFRGVLIMRVLRFLVAA